MPVAPKVVGSDTQPLVDIYDWTNENLAAGFQKTIFDRHRLISEPIYSVAMEGHHDERFWSAPWLGAAIRRFQEIEPIVIWCIPRFETVNHNVLKDLENRTVWFHIDKIYHGYVHAWLLNSHKRQILWDYEQTNDKWFRDRLVAMISDRMGH